MILVAAAILKATLKLCCIKIARIPAGPMLNITDICDESIDLSVGLFEPAQMYSCTGSLLKVYCMKLFALILMMLLYIITTI